MDKRKIIKFRKVRDIAFIAVFFLILAIVPVLIMLLPKVEFSENENRYLAKQPVLTVENILDKEFMQGTENYLSDHFVGRDWFVSFKSSVEYLTGKRENNGVFIANNMLIENIDNPDQSNVDKTLQSVINFHNNTGIRPYLMLVPTSGEIYKEELPNFATMWNQRDYIKNSINKLGDSVEEIDVYIPLYDNKDKYIYYRTDHHWTSLGGYIAYREAANKMKFEVLDLKNYAITPMTDSFYGTLYSKANFDFISPDRIDRYSSDFEREYEVSIFDGKDTKIYDSVYFPEYLEKKDKYSVFLGQNQPKVTIKHKESVNENKLLIIKDSFAHTIVPFFMTNYDEIVLIDLRYTNTRLNELVDLSEFSQVLMLYNVDTFFNSKDLQKLGWVETIEN